jgi:prolyl oligopeptidase
VYRSESKGEVRVSDPYQWLEENTDETEKWTTAQERFTRAYLDQNTQRQKLEDEIRLNSDHAKVGEGQIMLASIYRQTFLLVFRSQSEG